MAIDDRALSLIKDQTLKVSGCQNLEELATIKLADHFTLQGEFVKGERVLRRYHRRRGATLMTSAALKNLEQERRTGAERRRKLSFDIPLA